MKRKIQFLAIGGAALIGGTALAFTWPDSGSGSSGVGITATCNSGNCSGLEGDGSGTGHGVVGTHAGAGKGVFGLASSASASNTGVFGQTDSTQGIGVQGFASSTTGAQIGVAGQTSSISGFGLHGLATATTGATYGAYGQSNSSAGYGVFGVAIATTGTAIGGYFRSDAPDGIGVAGVVTSAAGGGSVRYGVYGSGGATNWAGWFDGGVNITDDLFATGTIGATIKAFRIDHPLDPANKYLNHISIESSEALNLYSGSTSLDARGEAWVTLPSWFEAINKDMRYQLTAVGAPGPNLHIGQKLHNNRFKIAGGQPGTEVSWQVSGVRHDPYVMDHPVVVEQLKSARERGYYLYPQGYGQPKEKSLGVALGPKLGQAAQVSSRPR